MIKKLRRKFVLICVISSFIVLLVIIGFINISNYKTLNKQSENMLSYIIDNNGKLPKPEKDKAPPDNHPPGIPPESVFQVRYFVALQSKNSKEIYTDTSNIYSVTSNQAQTYAENVISRNKTTGFEDNYKYLMGKSDGNRIIVFVDCTRELETFENFLHNSIIVSLLALFCVAIISYFLSPIAIKPLVNAYEKQKTFITNASHEIKTPLTVISANTDIIEMSAGQSKWIDNTKSQITRLSELINNLVSLSRLDEENFIPQKKNIDLSMLVENIAHDFESLAKEKNINYQVHIDYNIIYNANEKNIQQLVSILLDNAFKYCDENADIFLNLYRQKDKIYLEIYNTTNEIPKGYHNEFFDRFYRQDTSHNSAVSGYGIGLSLAKSIVSSHKGKISAKSTDGKSITMHVIL